MTSPTITEHDIEVTINDADHSLSIPPHKTLIEVLREDLQLTGTTEGCGFGICGSCTVLVDGKPISSCLELAINVDGKSVETIEGLSEATRGTALSPIQEGFLEEEGFQCGYCTPGILMTTTALLREHPNPSRERITEFLSENICRCTGYADIIRSVEAVANRDDHKTR